MDLTKLQELIDEYLATVDDDEPDEWYTTEKRVHAIGLEGFMYWLKERQTQTRLRNV